ncbi:MAG: hypothetical protein FH751_02540 [Firmicutes bacterium]|nr:hypothetical protein [Bacillota bacterium]
MNINKIRLKVLFFMLIIIISSGCQQQNKDIKEVSEIDNNEIDNEDEYFKNREKQINKFAIKNDAVVLEKFKNINFSIEAKEILRVDKGEKITFIGQLVDINKLNEKYYLYIIPSYDYYYNILFILECEQKMAERLVEKYRDEDIYLSVDEFLLCAKIDNVSMTYFNINTYDDEETDENDSDNYYFNFRGDSFIAKGKCIEIKELIEIEDETN